MGLCSAWRFAVRVSHLVVPLPGSMGYAGDWLSEGEQQPVARCDSKGWRREERCGLDSLAVEASNQSVRFGRPVLVAAG